MSFGFELITTLAGTLVSKEVVEALAKAIASWSKGTKKKDITPQNVERVLVESLGELEAKPDHVSDAAAKQAIEALEISTFSIKDERMRQARFSYNASWALIVAGTLMIFVGVGFGWFYQSVVPAAISAGGGVLSNILATIILRRNKEDNDRLDRINEDLMQIEKAKFAAEIMSDPKARDSAIAAILKTSRRAS
jgi:hypothetical protein